MFIIARVEPVSAARIRQPDTNGSKNGRAGIGEGPDDTLGRRERMWGGTNVVLTKIRSFSGIPLPSLPVIGLR